MASELKYKILVFIAQMNKDQAKRAKKELPKLLRKSKTTFDRWCYRRKDDEADIPGESLMILADYFNCDPEEIYNYPPVQK